MLRAVRQGEFRPPRQVDPEIDRALEAVCQKAMAHRPADRYATPRALADDVERWMADEPVIAWREPISRRARRWAKRNRTAVATVSAALLASVVGLAAVLVIQTQAKAEIALALGRETTANAALAASNLRAGPLQGSRAGAVRAGGRGHPDVPHRRQRGLPAQGGEVQVPARPAAEIGLRLLRQAGGTAGPRNRRGVAEGAGAANFELAMLTGMVGRPEDALAAHRSVLAMRRALAAEPGASAAALADVGRSLTRVATLLESTGKTDEATATYREAEALLTGPATGSSEARSALGDCRSRLGWLLASIGKHDEALAALRLARADQEALRRGLRRIERGPARPGGYAGVDRHRGWRIRAGRRGGDRVPRGGGDLPEAGRA